MWYLMTADFSPKALGQVCVLRRGRGDAARTIFWGVKRMLKVMRLGKEVLEEIFLIESA
jgi:hypothetical protein